MTLASPGSFLPLFRARPALPLLLLLPILGAGCRKRTAPPPAPGVEEAPAPAPVRRLLVRSAPGPVADGLRALAPAFAKASGATLEVEQRPAAGFEPEALREAAREAPPFDLLVTRPGTLGRGATLGLFLELTDWLPKVTAAAGVPAPLVALTGELAPSSGKLFGAPANVDLFAFGYRRDWFEDPAERAAFKKAHHRELAPPASWEELREVAGFFHRPAQKRAGVALATGRADGALVYGFTAPLVSFGGRWIDPKTARVKATLDATNGVQALDFWKELLPLGPPEAAHLEEDRAVVALVSGEVAMAQLRLGTLAAAQPGLAREVGFFPSPAHGRTRATATDARSFCIAARSAPAGRELAQTFLEWFFTAEAQAVWRQTPGLFPLDGRVVESAAFRRAGPLFDTYAASLGGATGLWKQPVGDELFAQAVRHLGDALDGKAAPATALQALADEQQATLARMAQ